MSEVRLEIPGYCSVCKQALNTADALSNDDTLESLRITADDIMGMFKDLRRAEREQCAVLAEQLGAKDAAAAIRARGR